MTPAQEASAIFRRKRIYEELHPETKHGGDRKSDQVDNLSTRSERFTAATSEATGKDERTIRRAAARGEALGADLKSIAGTSLDKGVELDALAKMTLVREIPGYREQYPLSFWVWSPIFMNGKDGRRYNSRHAVTNKINDMDARFAAAKEAGVPEIYFNGFATAIGLGDIYVVLERNGSPVAAFNASYTVAKTLSASLAKAIAQLEEITGKEMLMTHDLERALLGENEPQK
ncbi:hypothetical+protein [Methylocapsa aurea]|uniref:hypothetical protein n=1 Tax=Methylocapsa aurea TaxID=663610 RepID=UPI003D18A1BE